MKRICEKNQRQIAACRNKSNILLLA